MKKNIDYYPHKSEAHRHPKFKMLRSLYSTSVEGWAAEGRFWALNNLIAQAENCQLNLSKKRNKGVYADELGMSIDEFDRFIEILCSEDVELLTQIEPDIYTTETVQETYSTVANERERARKNKNKSANSTGYTENQKSYTELSESSPEPNNKVNKSEVNKMKLNKSEVENLTFLKSHFEKIKNLFCEHTRISDPNERTHLTPIAVFYSMIPEHLTESDIDICIEDSFKALNRDKGVKMEFLISNIQAKITAKHEETLQKLKKPALKEAEIERIAANKRLLEENKRYHKEKTQEYKNFIEKNLHLFNQLEKEKLLRLLNENKLLEAGTIIEPKMESVELA